jgi:hypothetical protein
LVCSAAPIAARQIGNLQCNLDRLEIVANLAKTQSTLKDLATAVSSYAPRSLSLSPSLTDYARSDATASAAVKSTTDSVSAAQGAIGEIGKALITFKAAPPQARITVQSSLLAANGTLAGVTSSDAATKTLLTQAQAVLITAIGAGDGVVSNCK